MRSRANVETVNQWVERRTWSAWLGMGLVGSLAMSACTIVLVGTADLVAISAAVLALLGGAGAAFQRRALDHLPLTIAPQCAVEPSDLGGQSTLRIWLGRGRRIDSLDVRLTGPDGEALPVWVPETPLVGRFHVLTTARPPFSLHVRVSEAGTTHDATASFPATAATPGRFAAGIGAGTPFAWIPGDWERILPPSEADC